jgi:hypothetical protein
MTIAGFDAWGEGPTPAAAKAAGMAFRTWYSSYDLSKDGPVSGPADYAAVGIWSVANFETTIDRALTGYAAGQQDVMHTINEFAPRGMPVGAAVILSADEPIPASQFPAASAYYQGARQAAASQYLVGCYGEQALIAYLKQHGAIDIGWRSMSTAWPGGASTAFCDLVQTGSGQIGGVDVDLDQALVPFFGQWAPGRLASRADPQLTPHPTATEDEMSTTSIAGRAGLSWAAGSRHVVQVTYDPRDGDPHLRVVLALTTGPWVLPDAWQPSRGSGVVQIPDEHIADCRGVILEGAPAPIYDATAV